MVSEQKAARVLNFVMFAALGAAMLVFFGYTFAKDLSVAMEIYAALPDPQKAQLADLFRSGVLLLLSLAILRAVYGRWKSGRQTGEQAAP